MSLRRRRSAQPIVSSQCRTKVSSTPARLTKPTSPLATRFVLGIGDMLQGTDEMIYQAALSNPNVSEEAKEHSAEVLDNLSA